MNRADNVQYCMLYTNTKNILNNNKSQKKKTPIYFLAKSFVNHCSHFQVIMNTTKLQSS